MRVMRVLRGGISPTPLKVSLPFTRVRLKQHPQHPQHPQNDLLAKSERFRDQDGFQDRTEFRLLTPSEQHEPNARGKRTPTTTTRPVLNTETT